MCSKVKRAPRSGTAVAWLSGSPDRPDGSTRRSGAGRDQLSEQLLDAEVHVVADAPHDLERLAGRAYGAEAWPRAAGSSPTKASSIQATR